MYNVRAYVLTNDCNHNVCVFFSQFVCGKRNNYDVGWLDDASVVDGGFSGDHKINNNGTIQLLRKTSSSFQYFRNLAGEKSPSNVLIHGML